LIGKTKRKIGNSPFHRVSGTPRLEVIMATTAQQTPAAAIRLA